MQDDKTRWSLTIPLTPEQLAWWQERMRHTIAHLRETFPRARLVFRKLHRTDDAVQGTQYITNRAFHWLPDLSSCLALTVTLSRSVRTACLVSHCQDCQAGRRLTRSPPTGGCISCGTCRKKWRAQKACPSSVCLSPSKP